MTSLIDAVSQASLRYAGGIRMKIAVASTGNHVARHFALCERFHIYMVYGGKIMKETDIPNPGLRPAMLPEFSTSTLIRSEPKGASSFCDKTRLE